MRRVLILGGGFGGLAAAHHLRAKLDHKDEIILADQRAHFMVGFRQTWALVGASTMDEGLRPLAALERKGIHFIHAPITQLDPDARAATIDGKSFQADAIIIALGAELASEKIPGFASHAINFYDRVNIPRAADALRDFTGARLAIGIFGAPYKCPPAPYELALLTRDFFARQGKAIEMDVFTPQPMSLPVLGQASCSVIENRLSASGINFMPNLKAASVEKNAVVFANGKREFDLLLGVPPHRVPAVIAQSGLTNGGDWIKINPRTTETKFANVYAVGDVVEILTANGKPLPKAGVFAEAMARVAAERIIATFENRMPTAQFDGAGGCFLEVGNGEAMMVQGEFLAEPAPRVSLTDPSEKYLADKRAFEAERLRAWLE
ncbi:MAG: NAD(P)/FAD-dependent oxidoreductase [Chloroflexi bacterium]|nr:NAD(P)/FAD-dependent oxidoreductase [Chloroflexota bacterium]